MTDQELDKALQERLKQMEGSAPQNWIVVGSYVILAVMLTIALFVVAAFT